LVTNGTALVGYGHLQAGASSPLTSPVIDRARFNRVETDEGELLLHAAQSHEQEDRLDLVTAL
jgi:hypothetical protein